MRINNCQLAIINYSVAIIAALYQGDALELHHEIGAEQDRIGAINHERAKNLSSLSQLYLAMGRMREAETLQKQAIDWIDDAEQPRNYGYLAQIAVHRGRFDAAQSCLDQAEDLLAKANDAERSKQFQPFLDLYRAECLYRQGGMIFIPVDQFSKFLLSFGSFIGEVN